MKKNYVYALSAVAIWSTMATAVKLVLADIPNLQALAVSSLFAFLFLLAVNIRNGKIKSIGQYTIKDYGTMSALGFIGLFVYSALYYYGIGQLGAQEACILNYLWPIMLTLFSCLLLKEKLTAMKMVAMGCSFLGIIILSLGNIGNSSGNAMLGIAGCIIAAACYGLFSVLNKKADFDQEIAMMIIWLTTAICSFMLGPLIEDWVTINTVGWIGILWLGILADAVAYLWWALALKGADNTAVIANLAYLTPFCSVIISALVLKEKLQPQALVALIFIVGGILIQQIYDRQYGKR